LEYKVEKATSGSLKTCNLYSQIPPEPVPYWELEAEGWACYDNYQNRNGVNLCLALDPDPQDPCGGTGEIVGDLFGVDQWWVCGTPDPDHCSNSVKDEDEEGIDCGGSCSAECVLNCPDGTELQGMYVTGEPWRCVQTYQPDNYGNCESFNDYIINGQCEKYTEPYASFEEVTQPPVTDPWTQTSTMNISTSESIVDNQDGTKTKTTTTTTTTTLESGVETTVTTKTDIIDSATEDLISTSTDVETTDTTKKLDEAYTIGAVQDQTKTLSSDLSKIENELGKSNDKLDYINSNIVSIKGTIENIGGQFKEELPDTFVSDIGQDLEDASNNTVDVIEAETIGAAQSGATDYGTGQTLPVAEGLTGKLNDILPDYSACTTGVTFEFVSGSPWTIGCEIWDMIKMWLGWIMYILTAYFIVDMFFSTAPK
jgi:hypothetical protein